MWFGNESYFVSVTFCNYYIFAEPCDDLMQEEGSSPIERYSNGVLLRPKSTWQPNKDVVEDLIIEFPEPSQITSIRVTDELSPVYFKVYYRVNEVSDYVLYELPDGPIVSSLPNLLFSSEITLLDYLLRISFRIVHFIEQNSNFKNDKGTVRL